MVPRVKAVVNVSGSQTSITKNVGVVRDHGSKQAVIRSPSQYLSIWGSGGALSITLPSSYSTRSLYRASVYPKKAGMHTSGMQPWSPLLLRVMHQTVVHASEGPYIGANVGEEQAARTSSRWGFMLRSRMMVTPNTRMDPSHHPTLPAPRVIWGMREQSRPTTRDNKLTGFRRVRSKFVFQGPGGNMGKLY